MILIIHNSYRPDTVPTTYIWYQHLIILCEKCLQLIAHFLVTVQTNTNIYNVAACVIRILIIRLSACVNLDFCFDRALRRFTENI